jgi:Undecaprenyl-phosphate glucose phosphotransferase
MRRPALMPEIVSGTAMLIDAAALGLGIWFAAFFSSPISFDGLWVALQAGIGAALVVLVAGTRRLYAIKSLRRLWIGTLQVLAAGVIASALVSGPSLWSLAIAIFVVPARLLSSALAAATIDFGLTERRAVIVGGGERAEEVIWRLAENPDNDIQVCAIFDDRDDLRSPLVVAGVPKLGSTDTLLAFARQAEIDLLIVAIPLTAEQRIRTILKKVEVLPLDVRLSDFNADQAFRRHGGHAAKGGLIEVISRPIRGGRLIGKRAIDVTGALAALVLLSPIMLLTALAIRLDSKGPILFRQPRHGYNHRPISVWKFRSMHASDCDPAARRIVTRGDPRVTRVGRFIRRWSIDELPQLINVLKGDLSLVGPRPHALAAISSRQEAFEDIVENYAARHKVRPGITGWAQIHGWRGEIDDPEALRRRVEHDLYYIENWTVWLDLYVLAMTPLRLLDTRRAY